MNTPNTKDNYSILLTGNPQLMMDSTSTGQMRSSDSDDADELQLGLGNRLEDDGGPPIEEWTTPTEEEHKESEVLRLSECPRLSRPGL